MKAITLRSREMLKAPEIIEKEKKSEVEGVVEETEFHTETLREQDKGVKEPLVKVQEKNVPTLEKPYKPSIPYPQRLFKVRDEMEDLWRCHGSYTSTSVS